MVSTELVRWRSPDKSKYIVAVFVIAVLLLNRPGGNLLIQNNWDFLNKLFEPFSLITS